MLIGTEDWMPAPDSLSQLQQLLQPIPTWTPEKIDFFWSSLQAMEIANGSNSTQKKNGDAVSAEQPPLFVCAARSEAQFLILRPAAYPKVGDLDEIARKLVLSLPDRIGITDFEELAILPHHDARRGTGTEYIEYGDDYFPTPIGRWVVEDAENSRFLAATVFGSSIRYLMLSLPRIESLIHDLIAYTGQSAGGNDQ